MKTLLNILLILVLIVSCNSNDEKVLNPKDLKGKWTVLEIKEKKVIDQSRAHFNFKEDGKMSGNTSCNNFFGTYQLDGNTMTFSKIGATKMLCHGESNTQEMIFLSSIPESASIKKENKDLIIRNDKNEVIFKLTRME